MHADTDERFYAVHMLCYCYFPMVTTINVFVFPHHPCIETIRNSLMSHEPIKLRNIDKNVYGKSGYKKETESNDNL